MVLERKQCLLHLPLGAGGKVIDHAVPADDAGRAGIDLVLVVGDDLIELLGVAYLCNHRLW